MKRFTQSAAMATFALLAMVAFAWAQERNELDKTKPASGAKPAQSNPPTNLPKTPQPPANQPALRQANWQAPGDSQLATWLFAESEAKIELAKFAMTKTKNEEVAELARQEVFDHSEFMEQLLRFGPLPSAELKERATEPLTPIRTTDQSRPVADNRAGAAGLRDINNPFARPRDALAQAARDTKQVLAGRVDLARVKQELARERIATFKKEVSHKTAADFDKCYVSFNVMGHLQMADTVKVMKRFASADMRSVLEEGERVANEHLDHARMLLENLDRQVERTASNADLYRELK